MLTLFLHQVGKESSNGLKIVVIALVKLWCNTKNFYYKLYNPHCNVYNFFRFNFKHHLTEYKCQSFACIKLVMMMFAIEGGIYTFYVQLMLTNHCVRK